MKARAVKSFPIGKRMDVRPEVDGFVASFSGMRKTSSCNPERERALLQLFRKSPRLFRALSPKRFVLDGELAMPTEKGFSFDGLVNRLRIGSARLALEVRDSPAIYIVFDMLAHSENLLGSPFQLCRKTLERFFGALQICRRRS